MSHDFTQCVSYIREHLRVSTFDLPVDGAGITSILKQSVRDNRLIPAVHREWSGNRSVFRHYAPQYWPNSGGGSVTSSKPLSLTEFYALKQANGEPGKALADGGAFDLSSKAMGLDAAASASDAFGATIGDLRSAGTDWLGMAIEVAGAVAGGALGSASDKDDNPLLKNLTDGDTPISDAEPFEFESGLPDGDGFDLAGIPFNGDPGWVESGPKQKKQWRMYGSDRAPVVDIDFDDHHGQPNPHAHNWDDGVRDHGWPVSVFPR
ncbi:hypothetical protein AWB75_05954 [Caballeronia catudaia]|uniref:Uncharacterized protein n=1 Tax=Caballeronia catudaia TaxID=1777136 RepID=A0A158CYX9_9BURK|nr:hypothetical protein [Caballeronia catudaia]SAK87489.1 hypothetical protein AWB75_05954 [Caballeronia catudaia]